MRRKIFDHCEKDNLLEDSLPEDGIVLAEEAMTPEDIRWKENEEGKIVFQGYKDENVRRLKIPKSIDGKQVAIISNDFEHYNKYLLSIEIPGSVVVIGKYAFFDCPRLEKITVDKSNPAYESDDAGALYNKGKSILICCPAEVKEISIPGSVRTIENNAFYDCDKLEKITVDKGNSAYESDDAGVLYNKGKTTLIYCPPKCKVASIKIPDSVSIIECGAFAGCKSLSSISIPSSVGDICEPFFCCHKLEKIVVDERNPMYESDDAGVLYNKGKTTLICCPAGTKETSIKIPSSVSVIKESAFHSCKNLIRIDIASGITDIGDEAFENCTSLTHIEIPEGVSRIGLETFKFCTSLLSVEIPDSVSCIEGRAFYHCSSLTSVNMPGVTHIGSEAFENCTSLTSIEIPEGVSDIADSFYGCENLESIKIPISVNRIRDCAFCDVDNLKDVYYAGSREQWDAIEIDMDGNDALNSAAIKFRT